MVNERGIPSYQMIMDAMPAPCALLTPDLVIATVNRTYAAVCGRHAGQLIGKKLFDAFPRPPDDPGLRAASASLARVLATGQADVLEAFQYDIPSPCGAFTERHWRVVNSPLLTPDGQVGWILHQAEDVSEHARAVHARRRAEEAAALAAAGRRSVLDSLAEGFITLDRQFRVLEINREGLRQDGRTAEEIIGRSHWEAWPASAGSAIEAAYHHALAEQVPVALEHHYTGEGHDRWLDVRVYPNETGLAVQFRDITERKQGELALIAARLEAEQANASKSKFLAAASHDLRQPMQSLFLFTDVLAGQIPDVAAQRTLDMLKKSLTALKGLLDSLFDVSRLDTGTVVPSFRTAMLSELVAEVAEPYEAVARDKGLSLAVTGATEGVAVHTDPTLLGRMLSNLLENAIRYTSQGRVTVTCRAAGASAQIEVADTGIGIPVDQLEAIFEEFHQVGNPERDRTQGLGLGLSIVKRLSALLGHPVTVTSRLGEGSAFTITLPVAPVTSSSRRSRSRSARARR